MRFFSLLAIALTVAIGAAERPDFQIRPSTVGAYTSASEVSSNLRLTGETPEEIAASYLKQIAPEVEVTDNGDTYTDEDTGITHVYFSQVVNGLKVENAQANVNLKDGHVFSSGSTLVQSLIAPVPLVKRAELSKPLDALKKAIEKQGYPLGAENAEAVPENTFSENAQAFVFKGLDGARGEPRADLTYYATDGGLKLVWRLETDLNENYMITYVTADTDGDVVGAIDYVADASYRVYPFGVNDPSDGERVVVEDPAVTSASPNGWHVAGSTAYSDTRGNNGFAQENWDGGSDYVNNQRGTGTADEVFDFPYSTATVDYRSYIEGATTQLFYTANMFHDLLELLGFTEAAGNFEEENPSGLGRGADGVQLNAQDGSGTNNANFLTPPDGQRPRMRMYVWTSSGQPYRDGDFDEGIVIHEYSHGLSNRLTGGPATVSCLSVTESGGMGEGWGDFYATAVRIKPWDTRETASYAMGDWANGVGVRRYNYSTSITINPTLYSTVGTSGYTAVHPIGSVWANILYEVLWNLEDKHGYQEEVLPTFREGTSIPIHGRQLTMKLVLEGMKLQPCSPTFLTARNAIIDADEALTGGENFCELWKGFAKRGLGTQARTSGSTRIDSFDVPAECVAEKKVRKRGCRWGCN